ncbi:hypothetical protein BS78_04G237500 [Paspalum vaginatum]|nr:hypothetical protein BS78_04G237500 [Paspalum vaginatum]
MQNPKYKCTVRDLRNVRADKRESERQTALRIVATSRDPNNRALLLQLQRGEGIKTANQTAKRERLRVPCPSSITSPMNIKQKYLHIYKIRGMEQLLLQLLNEEAMTLRPRIRRRRIQYQQGFSVTGRSAAPRRAYGWFRRRRRRGARARARRRGGSGARGSACGAGAARLGPGAPPPGPPAPCTPPAAPPRPPPESSSADDDWRPWPAVPVRVTSKTKGRGRGMRSGSTAPGQKKGKQPSGGGRKRLAAHPTMD